MTKNIQSNLSVCLADIHYPFRNPDAVKMAVDFIKEQRPGRIHLLGDLCDFVQISRFDKDPTRKDNLQDELDSVRDWLNELRDAAPKAKIIYSEGNHEYRLKKYLMSEAKALAGLRALSLEKLLGLDTLRIRFQAQDRPYRIGHLLFTHGQCCSKWSGQTARQNYEKYGCCVIHGHTHRLGAFYHSDIDSCYGAWEAGCLSTLTPDYVTAPDWQNGFAVVNHSKKCFSVELVAIIKNQFWFRGRQYGRQRATPSSIVEDLT
jgi:UDP-2,3-diacylglucosamine pyrophosphatase LpxH